MTNADPLTENRRIFEKDENKNVFVIMRYGPQVPFAEIERIIKETLQHYGLKAVLARDVAFHMQLWNNVRFCMDHSRYAIVVFERISHPEFNPNVSLELGYMLALRRPCLILKEQSLPTLPTDIIGQMYTPFNSHKVTETISVAIDKWLQKLGHSRIRPAEIITANTSIEANKERTLRIVSELTAMASDTTVSPDNRIIRQAASLSSLAISDNEYDEADQDGEFMSLLLRERRKMESMLEDGITIRLLVSPETQVARVDLKLFNREFVESNILPRYEQLISIIRKNLTRPNLQIVYVHRLRHDNILIIDESRVFIGSKRIREKGFPHTTLIYDPAVIRNEIHEFDIQFKDTTGAFLGIEDPGSDVYGSKDLKNRVIERLKESQREVKRRLGRLSTGKLSGEI